MKKHGNMQMEVDVVRSSWMYEQCGHSYFVVSFNCGEGKRKTVTQKMKGSPEGTNKQK